MRSEAHTDYNYNNLKFSADVTVHRDAKKNEKNAQHAEDASGINAWLRYFLLLLSPSALCCTPRKSIIFFFVSLLHNDFPSFSSFIQIFV